MRKHRLLYLFLVLTSVAVLSTSNAVSSANLPRDSSQVILGVEQTAAYLPLLQGKRVALAINNTSQLNGKSTLDTLLALGVKIVKGFGPEHGFRGSASAGATVKDDIDEKTGIPLVSLYGKKYKPTKKDMQGIDVLIFDMQDVGTRFYTYLSTLHYLMEACAENQIELLILDRPNPNDAYVDGPILKKGFESFVGLHPIPITHGLTFGEYAGMINGEGWLPKGLTCKLTVIKLQHYHHGKPYVLPIPPSPNLNTQHAIYLYPSTCLFEGTAISEGRGTMNPFAVIGSPALKNKYTFSFTPQVIPGMVDKPKYLGQICYGLDLRKYDTQLFIDSGRINLSWLKELYAAYPDKAHFFRQSFSLLAGTDQLEKQIREGKSVAEIRSSWEPALSNYKKTRAKYLLYPDYPKVSH
ncbi:DUF1343 domain-containing protein [Olivibacter ginsenosidimutans]|uniref:DUF1343 domain-containing protein n=1 Tax=Olivibacter ginsenosidimutans TaxID=1176537 RepID=A0ABP9AXI5_9SPHI